LTYPNYTREKKEEKNLEDPDFFPIPGSCLGSQFARPQNNPKITYVRIDFAEKPNQEGDVPPSHFSEFPNVQIDLTPPRPGRMSPPLQSKKKPSHFCKGFRFGLSDVSQSRYTCGDSL